MCTVISRAYNHSRVISRIEYTNLCIDWLNTTQNLDRALNNTSVWTDEHGPNKCLDSDSLTSYRHLYNNIGSESPTAVMEGFYEKNLTDISEDGVTHMRFFNFCFLSKITLLLVFFSIFQSSIPCAQSRS
jgi:hypothetical protein